MSKQRIFISYRRADSGHVTGRIHEYLERAFGKDAIFFDIGSIEKGLDFRDEIIEAALHARVMLVIIGRDWATVKNENGEKRLFDKNDFVRTEVETGLSRGRDFPIIPLFVEGAGLDPANLPDAIKPIALRNGQAIRPEPDFKHDMGMLIKDLERLGIPQISASTSADITFDKSRGGSVADQNDNVIVLEGDPTKRNTKDNIDRRNLLNNVSLRLASSLRKRDEISLPKALVSQSYLATRGGDGDQNFVPSDQSLASLLYQSGSYLLFIGDPGCGKSYTLMKLALELLEKAKKFPSEPVPVILRLSAWTHGTSLGEWLDDEIYNQYSAPRQPVIQQWVKEGKILLLLDGLDEVAESHRVLCVNTIIAFNREFGGQIVLSCRSNEYDQLSVKLTAATIVRIKPLTIDDIRAYFASCGERIQKIGDRLLEDENWRELLATPLMLTLVPAIFGETMNAKPELSNDAMDNQSQLIWHYVKKSLAIGMAQNHEPGEVKRTLHWLSNLAQIMEVRNYFNLVSIQPSLLRKPAADNDNSLDLRYRILLGVFIFLFSGVVGGIVFGIFGGWFYGLSIGVSLAIGTLAKCTTIEKIDSKRWLLYFLPGLLAGLTAGVIYSLEAGWLIGIFTGIGGGLMLALFSGLAGTWSITKINYPRKIIWDVQRVKRYFNFRYLRLFALGGLLVWAVVALGDFLADGAIDGKIGTLFFGTNFVLIAGVVTIVGNLIRTMFTASTESFMQTEEETLSEGLEVAFKNAVRMGITMMILDMTIVGLASTIIAGMSGLAGGLMTGLSDGRLVDGLSGGLVLGAGVGLVTGFLEYGGLALFQQLTVRLLLQQEDRLPYATQTKRLIEWLNFMARLNFLRRNRGQYEFVHLKFQSFFADLTPAEIDELSTGLKEK